MNLFIKTSTNCKDSPDHYWRAEIIVRNNIWFIIIVPLDILSYVKL